MENRDKELWEIAKKRVDFKKHLALYIIVNGFLWTLWWITQGRHGINYGGMPWLVWSTLGWGIGIIFSYYGAYLSNKVSDIEKEYEKLKNKENNNN